jgi:hypothetical protein
MGRLVFVVLERFFLLQDTVAIKLDFENNRKGCEKGDGRKNEL